MNGEKVTYKISMLFAILLQIANIVLFFVPIIEWYQPSYSQTNLFGQKEYLGWHTSTASMLELIYTLVIVLLPYVISLLIMLIRLFKMPRKKYKFFFAKLGCIFSFISFYMIYDMISSGVRLYDEYGAYFNITTGGILNLAATAVMFLFLVYLSKKTKKISQNNELLSETESLEINEVN